ncbi:Hypothetical protein PHPALM_19585 [Phytophthora palmivora]|uniref:Ty3 transposon capsid-like protein domain-containing protein n=1 Tax=Phytophthora palmivora TaxID=4796 RepID=A0A2P4XH08_9STRA|nr:Hypothetical protein PHPALM_19585 [Phytophthora palmivora]
MPTNAQLPAEIDLLNQIMAERTRVPSNLPGKKGEDVREWLFQVENACRSNNIITDTRTGLPGIAVSVIKKTASGWFLYWPSTTRSEEHTWGIFREHVLQHFEASNYQAVLREKLHRLKQTADIASYNGAYSALIYWVEGMSMLDQVLCYANGPKPRTRSYVKLEKPETLSDAMDLAVKYEVTRLIDDARDCQVRQETKKLNNLTIKHKNQIFSKKWLLQTEDGLQAYRGPYVLFLQEARTYQNQLFPLEEGPGVAGKISTTSVKEGHGVVESETRAVKIENVRLNVLCETPLIYKSHPLLFVTGGIRRGVSEHQLETKKFEDKNIRVKLGDNQIISGLSEAYKCVAVVYATPEEFDCILGIPFFEDMQPQIDWRGRQIKGTRSKVLRWERAGEICGSIEECGPVIAFGLLRSVEAKGLSAKRPDPCRSAALETNETSADRLARDAVQKVSPTVVREQQQDTSAGTGSAVNGDSELSKRDSTRGKDSIVEKMFTMGVVDEIGVQTKYITTKKLTKFLRIKTKSIEEPDFMLVLSNETIKRVARTLHRQDQSASVVTAKAQRYFETAWESFQDNPAFKLLMEYKDNIIDMVKMKLIQPNISPHAASTFCVRKTVSWRIVHDYQYLYSNTVRQSIPMARKEDFLDVMAGPYWLSTMDLMSVRMREEDIKFTAFLAPNGLWEYLVCNPPTTLHRLTSKTFRDLKNMRWFFDDIGIFTKSPSVDAHLDALHETLDILRENNLYVKLSKCGFCVEEIPCLGDFVGRNGVRMDPNKVQTIKDRPISRTYEGIHSFLGLTGYVQRFCPEYATVTASMFALRLKHKRNANDVKFRQQTIG